MMKITPTQARIAHAIAARFPDADIDPLEVARIALGTLYDDQRRGANHGRAKLTWDQVNRIRALRADGWKLIAIAAEVGAGRTAVQNICNGSAWR